jgi:hypothetical protein
MAKRKRLTKADGRAWLRRWRLVNQREQAELRRTSIPAKLEQLAALMLSSSEFGWHEKLAGEETLARERWRQLRRACGH